MCRRASESSSSEMKCRAQKERSPRTLSLSLSPPSRSPSSPTHPLRCSPSHGAGATTSRPERDARSTLGDATARWLRHYCKVQISRHGFCWGDAGTNWYTPVQLAPNEKGSAIKIAGRRQSKFHAPPAGSMEALHPARQLEEKPGPILAQFVTALSLTLHIKSLFAATRAQPSIATCSGPLICDRVLFMSSKKKKYLSVLQDRKIKM